MLFIYLDFVCGSQFYLLPEALMLPYLYLAIKKLSDLP
jgi:hypothetical protein